jgi:membrane fusion protein, copper/silver efflux system
MWTPKISLLVALAGLSVGQCSQSHEHHAPPAAVPPAHTAHGAAAPAPSGYAAVTIDPARATALGLSTETVVEEELTRTIRTVGVVALDETKTAHVHAKVRGFIESIQADFVGKSVRRGAPLCGIYSQAVLAAQLEFASLVRQRRLAGGQAPALAGGEQPWDAVVDAARRRLMLWDVPRAQIDRIERTLEPSRTFTLSAPRSGVIVAKQAALGNYVEPGTELYVISDLSTLWVLIDVYEADVPFMKLDLEARLAIEGVPDPMTSRVTFLAPMIDEATRTQKVRLSVENDGALKPGAFVTAEMQIPMGRGLVVPESAVVRTGLRNIVFVVHGPHVEPREVALGPLVQGKYRVDKGLAKGESVATGAQFLLDSESRLRATSAPGAGHGGH